MNRLTPILDDLNETQDPDDLMLMIIEALQGDIEWAPSDVGAMFTFIYAAKTPDMLYDEFPLVQVTEITPWGFKGFNYHWNLMRNYTFPEIAGAMYRINLAELTTLRSIPYQKFRKTPK